MDWEKAVGFNDLWLRVVEASSMLQRNRHLSHQRRHVEVYQVRGRVKLFSLIHPILAYTVTVGIVSHLMEQRENDRPHKLSKVDDLSGLWEGRFLVRVNSGVCEG